MNDVIDAQSRALVVQEEPAPPAALFSAMPPAQKLAYGREVASALKEMLLQGKVVINAQGEQERKPLIVRVPQKIRGEIVGYSEHVELEGWQTCGMLAGGATAVVRWTKPLEKGNGYAAFAEVLWNGQVIGAGEGHCDKSERRWANADDYAIKSMAQTRAQSRAFRSVFSWILVLAGFSATPADEVPPGGFPDPAPPKAPVPKPAPTDEQRQKGVVSLMALCRAKGISDETRYALSERLFAKKHSADLTYAQLRELYKKISRGDLA